MLPLSFHADGDGLWFATKRHRRIATNATADAQVQVVLGGYLDAIIIDGTCDDRPPKRPTTRVDRRTRPPPEHAA